MALSNLIITPKWKRIINDDSRVIFLEGTTGSGKSIASLFKLVTKVMETPSNIFFLVGESIPSLERNLIQSDNGILSLFGPMVIYKGSGKGGHRIEFKGTNKAIYLVSYRDKSSYKKILGSTSGGFFVDEINKAHVDFIKELFTRIARDRSFLICTSNGDEEDLMVYTDYLDRCDPYTGFEDDIYPPTLDILDAREQDRKHSWHYYFFGFRDNPKYTDEDIEELLSQHDSDSFEYLTKMLGGRGFREGLIYKGAMGKENFLEYYDDNTYIIDTVTIGIDVGGTDLTVFTLNGFTSGFKEHIVLDYMALNNANHDEIWDAFVKWFTPHYEKMGFLIYGAFIDSAAKIMRLTLDSRMKNMFNIRCVNAYKYTIKERVDWGITQLHQNRLLFTEKTKNIYHAFEKAQYTENRTKTDIREFTNHDHKDFIDSVEYGQSPFTKKMMIKH
jgi:PBSX family phage terminase large subunit